MKTKKASLITGLIYIILHLQAQVIITPYVLPTQGTTMRGGNTVLTYTVGQSTPTGLPLVSVVNNLMITPGFQQPIKPLPPGIPPSQIVCDDTTYTFLIYDTAGAGGTQIEWANNAAFDSSHILYSPWVFEVSVNENTTDTIWVRSLGIPSTIKSSPIYFTLRVRYMEGSPPPRQQDTAVCPGNSSHIFVDSAQIGVRYDLMVDTTIITSAYGQDTTITFNTGAIDTNTTFIVMATDTATGCSMQLASSLYIFTYKIGTPTPPVPISVSSNTAYTFHFVNLNPGYNGNEIEWALDSNFTTGYLMTCFDTVTSAGKDTSSCTISVTVSPNSDTMIWLRSVDTVTGCVSNAIATIAIVTNVYQRGPLNLDSIITLCAGNSANIAIPGSRDSLLYALRIGTTVVSSAIGNNTTLYLNTGTVSSSTIFNILSTDTANGDTATLGYGILVQALSPVDTPVIIVGDTFIYMYDTICYHAIANNGTHAVYHITSGGASVDSLTGCVSGITSNFTLQATVYGAMGCGSATTSQPVTITSVAPPVAPAPVTANLDSPTQVKIIAYTGITAGSGGNAIEFAYNPNFTGSTTYASPANINITLSGVTDTVFWLRGVNIATSQHSRSVRSTAATVLPTISAALLDKSNWVYSTKYSDEFDYSEFQDQYIDEMQRDYFNTLYRNFINKWNIANNWDSGQADYSSVCAYSLAGKMISVEDWGDCPLNPDGCIGTNTPPTGCGHEISFSSDGVVHFTARKLGTPRAGNCSGWTVNTDTFYYQTGELGSVYSFPLRYGMWEMRCKFPNYNGYPAFWNFTGGGDFTIIDGSDGNNTQVSNGVYYETDNTGCAYQFYKQTPCGFEDDWHTFTAITTAGEIVFFVDGKEKWSSVIPVSGGYYPGNMRPGSNPKSPIYINLYVFNWNGVPTFDSSEMQIDYFRYYTPKDTANTECFQNINQNWSANNYDGQSFSNGTPVTLESLYNSAIPPGNTPAQNNNPVRIANNTTTNYQSTPIAATNIVYTNETGLQKVYYQGQNGQLYNAYLQSGNWYEYPLENGYATIADVNGGIAVDQDRVYYCSTDGYLKFFQWVNNLGQWQNFDAQASVPCYRSIVGQGNPNISVDELGRVWFIGEDQNVYVWIPTAGMGGITGQTVKVTTDDSAVNDLIVHPCGCLMFYQDKSGHLVQHSWWNTWSDQGVIAANPNPIGALALDTANGILYYIGYNNTDTGDDVYSYTVQYNQPNTAGPQKLGSTCSDYDNANAWDYGNLAIGASNILALSPNDSIVYYLASDGNIWYYFNDKDHGTDVVTGNPINPNWYKTQLTHSGNTGIFTVQPVTGQLFYVDGSGVLNTIDWENADNPLSCPYDTGVSYPEGALYMDHISNDSSSNTTTTDSADGLSITVFPNPSNASFTFIIAADAADNIAINIYDIDGAVINQMKATVQQGGSQSLLWDAAAVNAGIYYYKAQTTGGKIFTGKLVKM